MRDLVILFVHVMATLARLLGPGGIRSVVAESVLVKQQLLILNRSRQRSPVESVKISIRNGQVVLVWFAADTLRLDSGVSSWHLDSPNGRSVDLQIMPQLPQC